MIDFGKFRQPQWTVLQIYRLRRGGASDRFVFTLSVTFAFCSRGGGTRLCFMLHFTSAKGFLTFNLGKNTAHSTK